MAAKNVILKDNQDNAQYPLTRASNVFTDNNKSLQDVVEELEANGFTYVGVATPITNPGTPTSRVFYFASQPATYPNFGNAVVGAGVTVLSYDGSDWSAIQIAQIVDNLTTEDATKILSAKQGKVLSGQVTQLGQEINGQQINITEYTKLDGGFDSTGAVSNLDSQWHSSPIALNEGEVISCERAYGGGSYWWIAEVTSAGVFVEGLVPRNNNQLTSEYTATKDMYVSVCYLKQNSTTPRELTSLVKVTVGVNSQINKLRSEVSSVDTQVQAIETSINGTVVDAAYTKLNGPINASGNVGTGAYWHSSPIALKKGETIVMVSQLDQSIATQPISITDSTASYYHPLFLIKDKYADSDYRCSYTAVDDCYVAVSYLKNGETPRELTSLKIYASGVKQERAAAIIESSQSQSVDQALDFLIEQRESDNSLDAIYTSRDAKNVARARFDRQKMINEVSRMSSSNVLVEGTCGYFDDGQGNITHGTITWKLYENGILYISGYGKFYDFIKGVSGCKTVAQVNTYVTQLGEHYWYYGFVEQNENGITPPYGTDKYKYATDEVMVYSGKRYVPYGDTINPLNNKPYGYAAPWYIYRTEFDWSYVTKEEYDAANPNGWQYDRVCIVEDTTHGGITYVGDWAFYRLIADSLILPNHVTKIGCWGVRYSPLLRTLVMSNSVTEIEDYGLSRHEALETVVLSNTLISLGYGCMSEDNCITSVQLPNTVTSVGSYSWQGDDSLEKLSLGNITTIPVNMASGCRNLKRITIPETVTEIKDGAFNSIATNSINIPASVLSIGNLAFSNCTIISIVLDSQSIMDSWLGNNDDAGRLFTNVLNILVKTTVTPSTLLSKFFNYRGQPSLSSYGYYTYNLKIN